MHRARASANKNLRKCPVDRRMSSTLMALFWRSEKEPSGRGNVVE